MTEYIIIIYNVNGNSTTCVYDTKQEFDKELEAYLRIMNEDNWIEKVETNIQTTYEKYPVDDYKED